MSDINVMAAIIQKHAVARVRGRFDMDARDYLCSDSSVIETAKALFDAGFSMSAGTVDQQQNDRLRAIEDRLTRVEGWAGISNV